MRPLDFSRRIPELDGIRGLAILMVLVWHYVMNTVQAEPGSVLAQAMRFGRLTWSGVDLFFVLSGFLIGGILWDVRKSYNYFSTFYIRRFYRILPLWLAMCAGLWVLPSFFGSLDRSAFGWLFGDPAPWYTYLTFTQNFWMARSESFGANWVAISWSLAVEEQFYLTLPLLIRFVDPRRFLYVVVAIVLAAPLVRVALFFLHPHGAHAAYVLPLARADALMLGVLLAVLVRRPGAWAWIVRYRPGFQAAFAILAVGVVALTLRAWKTNSLAMNSVGYTWLAGFYVCMLILTISKPSGWFARFFRARALTELGVLAYGIYLFHQAFLGMSHGLLRGSTPRTTGWDGIAVTAVALVLTLVLARASWLYFERPLVQRGHLYRYLPREEGGQALGGQTLVAPTMARGVNIEA